MGAGAESLMLYVIYGMDRPDAATRRLQELPAHRKHLDAAADFGIKIVTSGPLTDDGGSAVGSLIIVEAKTRDSVVAFNKADPYRAADIWKNVEIYVFDRKRG